MRPSTTWFSCLAVGAAVISGQWLHGTCSRAAARERLEQERRLVSRLQLTDLCLFTEARYTRHLSQADRHAAFQDGPGTMDHFPSGSLVLPPRQGGAP
jgi:ribonuclease I